MSRIHELEMALLRAERKEFEYKAHYFQIKNEVRKLIVAVGRLRRRIAAREFTIAELNQRLFELNGTNLESALQRSLQIVRERKSDATSD